MDCCGYYYIRIPDTNWFHTLLCVGAPKCYMPASSSELREITRCRENIEDNIMEMPHSVVFIKVANLVDLLIAKPLTCYRIKMHLLVPV